MVGPQVIESPAPEGDFGPLVAFFLSAFIQDVTTCSYTCSHHKVQTSAALTRGVHSVVYLILAF